MMRFDRFSFSGFMVALVAIVVALGSLAIPDPARADQAKWVTVPVYWDSGGVTNKVFYQMNTSADTVRTKPIYTVDWDWDAVMKSVGTTNQAVARLTFTATMGAAGSGLDSIYYYVEPGDAGGSYFSRALPLEDVGAVGNCAKATTGQPGPVFSGVLLGNFADVSPQINVALAPSFRLLVFGDAAAAAVMSGLKIELTYPQRRY